MVETLSARSRWYAGDARFDPAGEPGARRIQGPAVEPAHAACHSLRYGSVGHRYRDTTNHCTHTPALTRSAVRRRRQSRRRSPPTTEELDGTNDLHTEIHPHR